MTKNGKIILELIDEVTCHPTAEEVYRLLFEKGFSMSMATVYNNLNSLSDEGKIRKISINNQADRYDKLSPHDHLICTMCGSINDMFLKDRKTELEKETGCEIHGYDLQMFCVCNSCKSKCG